MKIVLATNIASLQAQRALRTHSDALGVAFERLASGQRINRPSDDPAGLALLGALEADIKLADVARRNVNDGISALHLADGALSSITSILTRIAELAEQAANGVYSNRQRSIMELEVQALGSEIERIAKTTQFNDITLLSGTHNIAIQLGFDGSSLSRVMLGAVQGTLQSLNLAYPNSSQFNHTVLGQTEEEAIFNARTLLDAARAAIGQVGQARGELGANESRLSASLEHLQNLRGNFVEAAGRLRDVDYAQEVSNMLRLQIVQQAGAAMLAHANMQSHLVLKLLS